MLIRPSALPKIVEPQYGIADWAAGYTDGEPAEQTQEAVEEEAPVPVAAPDQEQQQATTPSSTDLANAAEGWMTIQRGAFFLVIVGAVAVYLRMSSRRRTFKEDVGYEKTMA